MVRLSFCPNNVSVDISLGSNKLNLFDYTWTIRKFDLVPGALINWPQICCRQRLDRWPFMCGHLLFTLWLPQTLQPSCDNSRKVLYGAQTRSIPAALSKMFSITQSIVLWGRGRWTATDIGTVCFVEYRPFLCSVFLRFFLPSPSKATKVYDKKTR